MEKSSSGNSNKISEKLLNLFFTFLTALFSIMFLANIDSSLFYTKELDYLLLIAASLAFFGKNGFSGLHFLALTISYSVHCYSAQFVGNFDIFYSISWLLNAVILIKSPALIDFSIVYHLGLSFEPSMTRTTGLGMQMSFYCSQQAILIMAATLQRLQDKKTVFTFDSRHIVVVFIGLFMLSKHCLAISAGCTSEFLMLFASLVLFWSIKRENGTRNFLLAFLLGGVMVALISIANLLLVSEGLSEILRRRASAANLHPNRIAVWLFTGLWMAMLLKPLVQWTQQRFLSVFTGLLWITLVFTGSRLVLLLAVVSFAYYFFFSGKLKLSASMKFLFSLMVFFAALRFFQQFNIAESLQNERFAIWYSAWNSFLAKPFTGHGIMSFSYLPQSFRQESCFWLYDWNYPHAHQGILELLNWGGIPFLLAFAFIWVKAWQRNNAHVFRAGLLFVTISAMPDFAWSSPSLVAIATYFLFFNSRTSGIPVPHLRNTRWELVPIVILIIAILGAFAFENNIQGFELAGKDFAKSGKVWPKLASESVFNLKNDPSPKLHFILWQAAAGFETSTLLKSSMELVEKYPQYYVGWFLLGRMQEISNNYIEASNCYERSLRLEPRDLNGIRNSRFIISRLRSGDKKVEDSKILNVLCRGNLGLPILFNNPEYGSNLAADAKRVAEATYTNEKYPEIERFYLIKNRVEWGTNPGSRSIEALINTNLPAWIKDELSAFLLMTKFSEMTVSREELEKQLQPESGSYSSKAICKIALEQNLQELALKAYQQHRRKFNFRNKNHEDLPAQFYAAKAFLSLKKFQQSIFELERIQAYDPANPFIFELKAHAYEGLGQKDWAIDSLKMAIMVFNNARTLPYYRENANEFSWPEGDHWTLVIEKTLRKRDPEALKYCSDRWNRFGKRLNQYYQRLSKPN